MLISVKEGFISPIIPKPIINLLEGYNPSKTCEFHYDALGKSIVECHLLRHKIQDLINSGALIFKGATQFKVATTTTFDNQGEEVNAIVKKKDDRPDLEDPHGYLV